MMMRAPMIGREPEQGTTSPAPHHADVSPIERVLAGARLPLAVAVIALLAGLLAWRPSPVGIWHDDGVYAQLGRALATGHGYHLVGVPGSPPAARFPPAYPAVLAPLWLLAPTAESFGRVAVALNLLLLACAAGAFAWYARDRLRIGTAAAALAAVGGWLHLQLWYTAFVPLSEPLFVLVLVLTLAALERTERERAEWSASLVLLLLLLMHTRSIGIAFAAGAVLALAVQRRVRAAVATAVVLAAGMLPWWWWSRNAAAAVPGPLRDMLGSYPEWLGARIAADPAGFASALTGSFQHLLTALTRALFPGLPAALVPVLAPLAVLALVVGGRLLARRSRGAAAGLALYLAIVIVWPFPDLRLVAAIAPLLLLCLVLACQAALHATRGRRLGTIARAAVVGWAVVYLVGAAARLLNPASTQMQDVRSQQLAWAMAAVAQLTPADAVIGAPELWPAIPLHTGRLGAPSAAFRPGATDRPPWGLPEDQYRIWATAGIQYLITEDGRRVHGLALDQIEAACPGALVVLSRWEGRALVRLGWDGSCRKRLGVTTDP